MMMIGSLQKVARSSCRKLHTIISRETITPSSPTPSHLQTYNLSLLDQYSHHLYVPVIFFYPNHTTSHNKVLHLKKSLSQTLNQYYPFAGRFPTLTESYVNCNDDGVTFLETFNDSEMEDVIGVLELDKTVRSQLLADGLEWGNTANNLSPLAVQFTNFACGGTAVAVSMSHRIGDACTLGTFLNHWATLVRNNAADHQQHAHVINPHYISSPRSDFTIQPAHLFVNDCERVVSNFIFRNSKLQELKNKVSVMAEKAGTPLKSPTRVEVLTSLLYKAAVAADTTRCGGFSGPSYLFSAVDMRQKMMEKLPETTVGNIVTNFVTFTKDPSETELHAIVADMQKSKSFLQQVHNLQEVFENRRTLQLNMETIDLDYVAKKSFGTSSITRFPFKKIDFGWGKPAHAIMPMGSVQGNGILLTEARDGDGIEVTVTLETPLMSIFQNDKDLLAFSSDT